MKRKSGDRRGKPRFEIIGDLWGSLDVVATLTLVNLGLGGALLESPIRLPPESVHAMVAISEGETHTITARVRHCVSGASGDRAGRPSFMVGVEFLNVSPALHEFLARQLGDGSLSVEA
jgi:hypothetical protein